MLINSFDYWLARAASALKGSLWTLGNLETRMHARRLDSVKIERPVYVCGLARAGSTMLLELLAKQPGVVSHRYQDFPFVTIPIWWNRLVQQTTKPITARPRAHRDLIRISSISPEGMEEILWDRYGHWQPNQSSDIKAARANQARMYAFYSEHIRKLLWLRNGQRYLAKNNYLVPRIRELLQYLPALNS